MQCEVQEVEFPITNLMFYSCEVQGCLSGSTYDLNLTDFVIYVASVVKEKGNIYALKVDIKTSIYFKRIIHKSIKCLINFPIMLQQRIYYKNIFQIYSIIQRSFHLRKFSSEPPTLNVVLFILRITKDNLYMTKLFRLILFPIF